jgi:hypothetical protein
MDVHEGSNLRTWKQKARDSGEKSDQAGIEDHPKCRLSQLEELEALNDNLVLETQNVLVVHRPTNNHDSF